MKIFVCLNYILYYEETMIYKTREDVEYLTDCLLDRSLPKHEWTHAAHLAAAFCLLHRCDLSTMIKTMPNTIRTYNEATNTPNTDTDGYHQTITLFYLKEIHRYVRSLPKNYEFADACHKLISSEVGNINYPFKYYSKERLFSVLARYEWVDPDLKELQ